jgi:hypothetical protein
MKKLFAICLAILLAAYPLSAFASGPWGIVPRYHEVDASGKVIGDVVEDIDEMKARGEHFVVQWPDGNVDTAKGFDMYSRDELYYYIPGYKKSMDIERPAGDYILLQYPLPTGYEAADKTPPTVYYDESPPVVWVDVYVKKGGGGSSPAKPSADAPTVAANITMTIEGKKAEIKLPILNISGRTLYPFRECMELIKAEVSWDAATRTAKGVLGANSVEFVLDSATYKANGSTKTMDEGVKAFVNDDRTYIPIRYAAEALGYKVGWDAATNTISLTK